jgi:hypothetical protein
MLRIISVQVLVYPALGSNSGLLDEAPIATISGSNTGLMEPYGIALDSAGKIYVTDNLTAMVSVFGALGNQAGTLNETPLAVIGGSKTGLSEPQGIAIDSHSNIYVADLGGTYVFAPVGAGTGNLNEAPIATIGELTASTDVAIDSSDNIYITDSAGTVEVFPPFTSTSENTPITTISGPQTGLNQPQFIAVQGAFGPTPTPTPTTTPIPTRTPTASPTPTAPQTPTPTPTPTPIATPIRTPVPTPTAICPQFDTKAAAAKSPKLPKLKAVKFPSQTVGTTSSPAIVELPATNGLMVTGVTTTGDFAATDTCVGQPLPCSISVTYLPSKTGTSHGTLSIANNIKTISTTLSGTGVGPKVKSLSDRSLPPLSMLTLNGLGFDPDQSTSLLVSFSEKIKKVKQSVVLIVPASSKTGNAVWVQVPPIFDPTTKELIPGTATLSVQETLKSGQTLTSKSPALQISQLNSSNQLPAGTATLQFLTAEKNFATQLEQDVMNDPSFSTVETSLMSAGSALDGLISLLSADPDGNLGTIGTNQISENTQNLAAAADEILQMLATMAGNTVSSARSGAAASGGGCLATEAQVD